MRWRAKIGCIALLIGIAITCSSFAQNEIAQINSAIKTGTISKISFLLDRMVDITIENKFNTYSKAQGEIVLDNFFKKQKIKHYEIVHSGQSNNGRTQYLISQMQSKRGQVFRLFFMLRKESNNQFLIQSIRIES